MKTLTTTLFAFLLAAANVFGSSANTLTLTATVTNEFNQPVGDADAVLINYDTRQVIKASSTTVGGEYVFEGLSSGDYILSVSTHDKKCLETEKVNVKQQSPMVKKAVQMKPQHETVR